MPLIREVEVTRPAVSMLREYRLPHIHEDGRVWLIGERLIASDKFLAPWVARTSRAGSLKDTVLDVLAFKGQFRLVIREHSGQVGGPTRWPIELPLRYALGCVQYVVNDVRSFPMLLPLIGKR